MYYDVQICENTPKKKYFYHFYTIPVVPSSWDQDLQDFCLDPRESPFKKKIAGSQLGATWAQYLNQWKSSQIVVNTQVNRVKFAQNCWFYLYVYSYVNFSCLARFFRKFLCVFPLKIGTCSYFCFVFFCFAINHLCVCVCMRLYEKL